MATRRNYRTRRPAPKRNMFWARRTELVPYTNTNQGSIISLLSNFNSAYGASLFGFTVTRIRGHYTWYTAGVGEPSTTSRLSVGIRTDERSDAATASTGVVGIADTDPEQAVKAPYSDPYADWMYARNDLLIFPSTGDASPTQQQIRDNMTQVDIKSQRKLSELGENLYLMAEVNTDAEDDPWYVWYDLHILLKQP